MDALGGKLFPDLPVVVQLAVVREYEAIFQQWLIRSGAKVDYGEPPMGELHGHPLVDQIVQAARVRTAVCNSLAHCVGKDPAITLLIAACDPAHDSTNLRRGAGRCGVSPRLGEQPVVDGHVGVPLVDPGQLLFNPHPSELPHLLPARLVLK